jgi:hypothetical protein
MKAILGSSAVSCDEVNPIIMPPQKCVGRMIPSCMKGFPKPTLMDDLVWVSRKMLDAVATNGIEVLVVNENALRATGTEAFSNHLSLVVESVLIGIRQTLNRLARSD